MAKWNEKVGASRQVQWPNQDIHRATYVTCTPYDVRFERSTYLSTNVASARKLVAVLTSCRGLPKCTQRYLMIGSKRDKSVPEGNVIFAADLRSPDVAHKIEILLESNR